MSLCLMTSFIIIIILNLYIYFFKLSIYSFIGEFSDNPMRRGLLDLYGIISVLATSKLELIYTITCVKSVDIEHFIRTHNVLL